MHVSIDPLKYVDQIFALFPILKTIIAEIANASGQPLAIGGAVRDLMLQRPFKDLDIEVYHLPLESLETILKKYGPVSLVGKSFGVLRMHGLPIDWSIPRFDAPGRKPHVTIDPEMDFIKAFARRDLTINAIGLDMVNKKIIDPFHGIDDLNSGILRTPDAQRFVEDPLRLFRVMQFVSRFEMTPDQQLNEICATMDTSTVARERIELECEKMLLQSHRPSLGLRWLDHINRLHELMPELSTLKGLMQDKYWHPEGDVFEHTLQTIDAAAQLRDHYDNDFDKLMLMYAALCHDLGKKVATQIDGDRIHNRGHAQAGEPIAKKMLRRIVGKADIIRGVCKLVSHHMAPGELVLGNARLSRYKRLAQKLAPETTIEMLGLVALADKRARNPKSHEPLTNDIPFISTFIANARQANILHKPEEPILQGKDLLDIVAPGPTMGKLLKRAYEIQLEENVTDKNELKKRVLAENDGHI